MAAFSRSQRAFVQFLSAHPRGRFVPQNSCWCPLARFVKGNATILGWQAEGEEWRRPLPPWALRFMRWFDERCVGMTTGQAILDRKAEWCGRTTGRRG